MESSMKTPLKGLYEEGVWKCDCNPRRPAKYLETRKEGKNQGRMFYTCDKFKSAGNCGFFLWGDVAKGRMGQAVVSNSRTEPDPRTEPTTPERPSRTISKGIASPITPQSNSKANRSIRQQEKIHDWVYNSDAQEVFGNLGENDFENLEGHLPMLQSPETPSKAQKTSMSTTPRKRGFDEFRDDNGSNQIPTRVGGNGVFPTPNDTFRERERNTATEGPARFGAGNLMTPGDSVATSRTGPPRAAGQTSNFGFGNGAGQNESPLGRKSTSFSNTTLSSANSSFSQSADKHDEPPESELATDILKTLRSLNVEFSTGAMNAVKAIAHRHMQKMRGVDKGREVSWEVIKEKDSRIRELQAEIGRLKGLAEQMK